MDSDSAYEFDSDDMMDSDDVAELPGDDSNDSAIRQENFNVLGEADVLRRQEDDITAVTSVLFISRIEAGILLRYYKWCVSKVHEAWFSDEERVRQTVGILKNPVVDINNERTLTCGICFETTPKDEIYAASCGHPFCSICWAGYISTAIDDGPGCIMLRCPDPSCTAALGQDMIDDLVSEDHKKKYVRFLVRSYIEDSKKMKWCPAAGCEYAVNFEPGRGDSYDVICSCSYGFCWKCTEETHRPVDCETVAMWIAKNCAESENTNWILANTKPCPKCKKSIEKNQGCMHMTCRAPCKFEFCWLCLGPWEAHRGGYNACNVYNNAKGREYDETEKRRERAKRSLERYTHYYERWASNHSSRRKAMEDLQQMQNVELEKLIAMQGETEGQTIYIIDAWQQIVECRRVLKWTYAYGFYLPAEETAKRELFEYLQGEAESGLERLHQCAEKEIREYICTVGPSEKYTNFRTNLINLTRITKNYFENLVQALENGLSDVNPADPRSLGEDDYHGHRRRRTIELA